MKYIERQNAIRLRKLGKSYNEIMDEVAVSKSTLSLWLRSVSLAKRQLQRLTEKRRIAQRKAVYIVKQRRIEKTAEIKRKASLEIMRLSTREKWMMGICLYWAEGTKEKEKGVRVQFSNSDPHMIVFFQKWAKDFLHVNHSLMTYALYIHEKAPAINEAIGFWADFLHIEPHELSIVFKKHNPSPKRKNIGVNYRGLVRITIRKSIDMNRKINGWIDGIVADSRVAGE